MKEMRLLTNFYTQIKQLKTLNNGKHELQKIRTDNVYIIHLYVWCNVFKYSRAKPFLYKHHPHLYGNIDGIGNGSCNDTNDGQDVS